MAAIKLEDGVVVVWKRHSDCYKALVESEKPFKPGTEIQGFVKSKSIFVTREEALKIILENDQKIRGDREFLKTQKILFSEDLY